MCIFTRSTRLNRACSNWCWSCRQSRWLTTVERKVDPLGGGLVTTVTAFRCLAVMVIATVSSFPCRVRLQQGNVQEAGQGRTQQRQPQLDGGMGRRAGGRGDEAARMSRRERWAAQRRELERERAAVAASVATAQDTLSVAASALQVRLAATPTACIPASCTSTRREPCGRCVCSTAWL